jgi:hypothetical protein
MFGNRWYSPLDLVYAISRAKSIQYFILISGFDRLVPVVQSWVFPNGWGIIDRGSYGLLYLGKRFPKANNDHGI